MVSAVVSPTGASRFLLHEIGLGRLPAAASVPLLLEYEAVLKRPETLSRHAARLSALLRLIKLAACAIPSTPRLIVCSRPCSGRKRTVHC
ncbi:hypothetical protein [Thiobaca trueperi]|uniref:hypothetical protein n=1 Tax=Thiobaca trueperi TaxID=127458 RepID=UPI001FB1CF56